MKKVLSGLLAALFIAGSFSCKVNVVDSSVENLALIHTSSVEAQELKAKSDSGASVYSEVYKDCNVTPTDLGSWNNAVEISSDYFAQMQSGDYLIIKTESNWSNDDRQLQLCLNNDPQNITVLGGYGSLSDSTYLGEWKCYTLYSGYQETKFFASDSEIAGLKEHGLLIKGKGVKVVSVKIHQTVKIETSDEDTNETENKNGTYADSERDCNVSSTDLGSWNNSVVINPEYFAEVQNGKYITIKTESNWSNDDRQLQLCLNNGPQNITVLGSYNSLSDSTYLGEWKCYTLNSGNQETKFFPEDWELEGLKEYGLLIKGKGVKVVSVKVIETK